MTRDLDVDIGRLIDGDLDRAERLALLAELTGDPRNVERLASAVRLAREVETLGRLYDEAEPDPGLLPSIFAALDKETARPSVASAMSGLTAAARRLLQPLDDARLAGVIAGAEPPPLPVAAPDAATPGDIPEECASTGPEAPAGPRLDGPAAGEGGSIAFGLGAGQRVAGPGVQLVDLGDLGAMADGKWQLVLDSGAAEAEGSGQIVIHAAAGGRIVLLDGSTLSFSAPLAIVWRKPS